MNELDRTTDSCEWVSTPADPHVTDKHKSYK